MPNKPFTLLASQTRLMKSKITKRPYRISISLPLASIDGLGIVRAIEEGAFTATGSFRLYLTFAMKA